LQKGVYGNVEGTVSNTRDEWENELLFLVFVFRKYT